MVAPAPEFVLFLEGMRQRRTKGKERKRIKKIKYRKHDEEWLIRFWGKTKIGKNESR